MKTSLLLVSLFGTALLASAQTTILYQQDFGTTNGGTTLTNVGWSEVLPPGGFSGIYVQAAAHDGDTAEPLPTNTLYFGGNAGMGMFYTTNGAGSGPSGDSAFTSIDPTLYTNLQISVESQWSWQGYNLQCWFALQVGGNWYLSTNNSITTKQQSANETFYKSSLTYSPAATNWNYLTNSTTVVIGEPVSANLSGLLTGVGVVCQLTGSGSWNYNNLLITSTSNSAPVAPTINGPPLSQSVYAGGGVSFAVHANGTQPFTYSWQKDGVTLTNSARVSGATTDHLTMINASAADAGTYSVVVSNSGGSDSSLNYTPATLTVDGLPANYLYAEKFPFVGPLATGFPLSILGWSNSIPDNPNRLYQNLAGDGAAYAYEGSAMATFFYVTTNSDSGASGLPFRKITAGSYPAVAFSVDIAPSWQPANVSAYCAVQINGGNWYINSSPLSVDTSTASQTFSTYQQQFTTLAAQWKNLAVTATGATLGSAASADLSGDITGAGLVFVHTGAGTFNFDNFLLTTDSVAPTAPTITSSPYSQSVYSGAGVSFTVAATGTQPLSYQWQKDGTALSNGPRISGANSNVLTIVKVTTADQGQYSVLVTNTAGSDTSLNYVTTALTVTDPTNGLLYAESFPYIGPGTGGYPVSSVGWGNAIPNYPNRLFQIASGDGAVYAYQDAPVTTAFFATQSSDNGTSGLPLPGINLAFYPHPVFLVDIAPNLTPENVSGRVAVQIAGAWYAAATALPVDTTAASGTYTTYTHAFDPAAGNWRTLTLTPGSGATIGAPITWDLSGTITGTGLVFTHSGSGTFNFDNFLITSSGIGGINVSSVTASNLTLSWVGNPSVHLQSRTNLGQTGVWQDVTGTAGQYSVTVPTTAPQMFFRLVSP